MERELEPAMSEKAFFAWAEGRDGRDERVEGSAAGIVFPIIEAQLRLAAI